MHERYRTLAERIRSLSARAAEGKDPDRDHKTLADVVTEAEEALTRLQEAATPEALAAAREIEAAIADARKRLIPPRPTG